MTTKPYRISVAIVTCITLAACASARNTYTPDGRAGHTIDCSGGARHWGMCQSKAGHLCKERGYDVLSAFQDGHPLSISSSNSSTFADQQQFRAASNSTGFSGVIVNRTMLIACK